MTLRGWIVCLFKGGRGLSITKYEQLGLLLFSLAVTPEQGQHIGEGRISYSGS